MVTSYATKVVQNNGKACAIRYSGSPVLYCWGGNGIVNSTQAPRPDYRMETISSADITTPRRMFQSGALNGKNIKDVALADYASCVVSDGGAWCWGYNDQGQLAQGVTSGPRGQDGVTPPLLVGSPAVPRGSNLPLKVGGDLAGKTVVQISSGNYHFCATTTEPAVYCWGSNGYGQLGLGYATTTGCKCVTTPTKVKLVTSVVF